MSLIDGLVALAEEAGAVVLRHFEAGCAVEHKADSSPVTVADREAEAVILVGLARLAPGVPVVAEEQAAAGFVPKCGERFFLVDPLDGTREFVTGNGDFTVNIALVEHGAPALGVVVAPARGESYWGRVGEGAWMRGRDQIVRTISVVPPHAPPRAVASRSHDTPEIEAWLARLGVTERVAVGSSLKFCLLAAGEADVYPRFTPTMEWDTAAGDAVLRAAGGRVVDIHGEPLAYGKPDRRNGAFVAWGGGPIRTS